MKYFILYNLTGKKGKGIGRLAMGVKERKLRKKVKYLKLKAQLD